MSQRDHHRSSELGHLRPQRPLPRRGGGSAFALQRAIGNRDTARMLARKGGGTFEKSVRIGPLGPIELTDSNIADWIGKKADVEDLVATTVVGKHSGELKRLSDSKTRIETLEVQVISGQNSWVVVTFKNAVIRGYDADAGGKTERWKAVRFDAVDIKRTSIGKPR